MTGKVKWRDAAKLRNRIAELEAKLSTAKNALEEIEVKAYWEISLESYTHADVCDLNDDFTAVGDIAENALRIIRGTPE